jgi:hypothetical protein
VERPARDNARLPGSLANSTKFPTVATCDFQYPPISAVKHLHQLDVFDSAAFSLNESRRKLSGFIFSIHIGRHVVSARMFVGGFQCELTFRN